jgi:hypothetical protein
MPPTALPAGGAPRNAIRTIAVFCGFNTGSRPEYMQAARDLGAEMARRNIGLVYGGGARPCVIARLMLGRHLSATHSDKARCSQEAAA